MAYRVHYNRDKGIRGRGRARLIHRVKRIGVAVVILLLVVAIVGIIYTWYMGVHGDKKSSSSPQAAARKEHVPPQTDPNAAVGVYIQSLLDEIPAGSNTAIAIRTQPEADCVITVKYGVIESKDSGLTTKRADEYGLVKWSWTIEPGAPLGKGTVDVTCTRNKKSGYMHGDFAVVKELSQQ